jgi:hypothetical protein
MKRFGSLAARTLVAALLLLALTANVASADPGTNSGAGPHPTVAQPVDPGSAIDAQPVDPGSAGESQPVDPGAAP